MSTSSTIIEYVHKLSLTVLATLAFFYFDHRDVAKQDARSLLSSLLIQLCDYFDNDFHEVLSSFFRNHSCGSRQPNEDALMECPKDMINLPGRLPVYIIVDALNACPNSSGLTSPRAEVLNIIQLLVESCPLAHLCIISRLEIDFQGILGLLPNHVCLHDEPGHRRDIAEYVNFVLRSDSTMGDWSEHDKQLVATVVREKNFGMCDNFSNVP